MQNINSPICQLAVSLLPSVLRVRFCQLLCNDQLRYVDPIAQQVRYRLLGIVNGAVWVTVNQDLLQAAVDEVCDQRTIVSAHRLNAFTVHLVVHLRASKVQARVPFLVDEQVRKINLTKQHVTT